MNSTSGVKRVVGFSGGADSQAVALWVRQRFPAEEIILLNADAGGNENPITTEFVRWYSEHIFPVVMVEAKIRDLEGRGTQEGSLIKARRDEYSDDDPLTFDTLAYIKGRFPSRKAQFCTEHLKLIPQRRWSQENLVANGIDFERYVGLRRDESDTRKNTPEGPVWDDFFDCYIHYPMATWTKRQVFEFLAEHEEPINPLYTMGFGRVGCAPCVNSGKEDVRNWAARDPAMIDKLRGWEARVGYTFFAPCVPNAEYNDTLRTWITDWTIEIIDEKGKKRRRPVPGAPPKPKRPLNWIDDVVAWSRTSRGGNQFELPMLDGEIQPTVCSSKYGLCE